MAKKALTVNPNDSTHLSCLVDFLCNSCVLVYYFLLNVMNVLLIKWFYVFKHKFIVSLNVDQRYAVRKSSIA